MKKLFPLAGLALLLAVIALGFSLFRIVPCEITTETYIGAIVTLLGIIVTLVVAYQIWSTIDIRESVKEIKRLDDELTVAKDKLKEAETDLEKAKNEWGEASGRIAEELENFNYKIRAENHETEGCMHTDKKDYLVAIYYFVRAVYFSLKCKN